MDNSHNEKNAVFRKLLKIKRRWIKNEEKREKTSEHINSFIKSNKKIIYDDLQSIYTERESDVCGMGR